MELDGSKIVLVISIYSHLVKLMKFKPLNSLIQCDSPVVPQKDRTAQY